MQRTANMKRRTGDHLGSMALLLAIVMGVLGVLAVLGLTGTLPGLRDGDTGVADTSIAAGDSAAQMERADYREWRRNQASIDGSELQANQMERADYWAWRQNQTSIDVSQLRADRMERADYLAWRQSQARPAPATQMDRADWLTWEQNTQLPTSGADESSGLPSGGVYGCPTVADLPLCQFYEQNTTLPTSGAPAGGSGIQGVNG